VPATKQFIPEMRAEQEESISRRSGIAPLYQRLDFEIEMHARHASTEAFDHQRAKNEQPARGDGRLLLG
jgi:hypothetical protein